MAIYKRGKVYWYKFRWYGKQVRESTKQGNDKVARQMEAAHRTSLAKGEVGIRERKPVPTLAEFCATRIEAYAKPRVSWKWYRSGIRAVLKYKPLATARIDEIGGEESSSFASWRLAEGLAAGSINSSLRVLRRILKLAVEWKVLEKSPKIEMLSGEARRERVVSTDEEVRYLAAAAPLLADVAIVLFDTGMRPDELHRMSWEHMRWENGRFGVLLVAKGKTSAARRLVPMTRRVRALLERKWKEQGSPEHGWVWPAQTQGGHIDHSSVRKQHRKALRLSKVRPFVLYSLRHTFLTRLGESGCDVWTLMRVAGHSSISISSRYVHPSDDAVLNAVDRMAGPNSGHIQEKASGAPSTANEESTLEVGVYLVSAAGLEPATHALKGHCSTN
jgi:integrase